MARAQRPALEEKVTVPALSDDQVAALLRPAPKELVSMRLDADVIGWLRGFGEGYSTRANAILRAVMEQAR